MEEKRTIAFVVLPSPESVEHAELNVVLSCFLLMKQAGQVTVSLSDLRALARDYSGFTMLYDAETETFSLVLRTRPDDHPAPEFSKA